MNVEQDLGVGVGGGVRGSEQMELLTSLIIMAGAAEGTSAGGR